MAQADSERKTWKSTPSAPAFHNQNEPISQPRTHQTGGDTGGMLSAPDTEARPKPAPKVSAKDRAVWPAFKNASERWVAAASDYWAVEIGHAIERCGSVLEVKLLCEMKFGYYGYNPNGPYSVNLTNQKEAPLSEHASKAGSVWIVPQYQVGDFRVDFAVFAGDLMGGWVLVCVECDGHYFHERTPEQATRDRARDRYFASAGIILLRFTESEINNDTCRCVVHIGDATNRLIYERLRAAGRTPRRSRAAMLPFEWADLYDRIERSLGAEGEQGDPIDG